MFLSRQLPVAMSLLMLGGAYVPNLTSHCDAAEVWPSAVGVSLAGPEFGLDERNLSNVSPGVHGVDFVYNSPATTSRVASAGFRIVRLPFRWERIQPDLSGPLDVAERKRLVAAVDSAAEHGLQVILDLHNYGRYRTRAREGIVAAVIDAPVDGTPLVRREDLADLWRRLALAFRGRTEVLAYGLMNEPHDMGRSSWKEISQAAVNAIRLVDDHTWICVAGDQWSHAHRFEEINGAQTWIRDPAERTVYEAHCYFDFDSSGRYRLSYDDELKLDPNVAMRGRTRIASFVRWLQRNNAHGLLGEAGVPLGDRRWVPLMADLSKEARRANIPVIVWAAGEWWDDYPLSIQSMLVSGQPDTLKRLGLTSKLNH